MFIYEKFSKQIFNQNLANANTVLYLLLLRCHWQRWKTVSESMTSESWLKPSVLKRALRGKPRLKLLQIVEGTLEGVWRLLGLKLSKIGLLIGKKSWSKAKSSSKLTLEHYALK